MGGGGGDTGNMAFFYSDSPVLYEQVDLVLEVLDLLLEPEDELSPLAPSPWWLRLCFQCSLRKKLFHKVLDLLLEQLFRKKLSHKNTSFLPRSLFFATRARNTTSSGQVRSVGCARFVFRFKKKSSSATFD